MQGDLCQISKALRMEAPVTVSGHVLLCVLQAILDAKEQADAIDESTINSVVSLIQVLPIIGRLIQVH